MTIRETPSPSWRAIESPPATFRAGRPAVAFSALWRDRSVATAAAGGGKVIAVDTGTLGSGSVGGTTTCTTDATEDRAAAMITPCRGVTVGADRSQIATRCAGRLGAADSTVLPRTQSITRRYGLYSG